MGNYFLDKRNAAANGSVQTEQPDNAQGNYFLRKRGMPDTGVPVNTTPNPRPPAPEHDVLGTVLETGKGALEGLAAANPVDIGLNVGNYINQKISQATGLKPPEHNLFNHFVSPDAQRGLRGVVQDHVTGPADPAHSTAHAIGEFVGGAAGPGLLLRGASAVNNGLNAAKIGTGLVQDLGAGAAAVGAANVATPVLGYAGEKFGNAFSPEKGRVLRAVGESIGDLVVPQRAARAVPGLTPQRIVQRLLADEQSPARLAAAERAGVTPSVGLVGSHNAARIEDYLASPSYSAGPILEARRNQFGEMDKFAASAAQDMRGGPMTQTGKIDKSTVGLGSQQLGRTIERNFKDQVSAQQQPIIEHMDRIAHGAYTRDPTIEVPLRGGRGVGGAMPLEVASAIDKVLNDPSIGSHLKPDVRALQQGLDADLQTARASMSPAAQASNQLPVMGYEALKEFRTRLGQRLESGNKLDYRVRKALYDAATKDMRNAAKAHKFDPDEFDRRQATTEELYNTDALDLADRLQNPKEGSAANVLFSPTNKNSPSMLETASRFSRDPNGVNRLRPVLADDFELGMRGDGAGSAPPSPETFNPKKVSEYWAGVPERARSVMLQTDNPTALPRMGGRAGGQAFNQNLGLAQKVNDLLTLAEADRRRPSRSLPVGGNSISGPVSTFFPLASALSAAALGSGYGALGSLGLMPAAWGAAKLMTNPAFARYVGAQPVPVQVNPNALNAGYGAMNATDQWDEPSVRYSMPVPVTPSRR